MSKMRTCLKLKTSGSSTNGYHSPERRTIMQDDYSPVFVPCTQETLRNVDVLWDWSSPQAKTRPSRKPKRLPPMQMSSPQSCIKKLPSCIPHSFETLRDDLRALQAEFERPGSPLLEFDDAELTSNNADNAPRGYSDCFNDSMEEELLLASQQIEDELRQEEKQPQLTPKGKLVKSSPRTLVKSFSTNSLQDSTASRFPNAKDGFMNDSLDNVLQQFDAIPEKVIENTVVETSSPSRGIQSQKSPNNALKFKSKSLSFGSESTSNKSADELLRVEIERKRQAALAKLRARQQKPQICSDTETSPIKCSPEEIELKRQQALAKLQLKRKQDLIDRNRQEALKRLDMNRRKRAL